MLVVRDAVKIDVASLKKDNNCLRRTDRQRSTPREGRYTLPLSGQVRE